MTLSTRKRQRCIYRCHNWRPLVRVWRCVWWAGDSSWSAEPSPARCGGCSSSSSPALTHIVKASPSGGRGGQQLTGLGGTCRQHRTPPATAASHLHWKYFAFRVDTRFKNKKSVCQRRWMESQVQTLNLKDDVQFKMWLIWSKGEYSNNPLYLACEHNMSWGPAELSSDVVPCSISRQ